MIKYVWRNSTQAQTHTSAHKLAYTHKLSSAIHPSKMLHTCICNATREIGCWLLRVLSPKGIQSMSLIDTGTKIILIFQVLSYVHHS